jgi:hypothetical protein
MAIINLNSQKYTQPFTLRDWNALIQKNNFKGFNPYNLVTNSFTRIVISCFNKKNHESKPFYNNKLTTTKKTPSIHSLKKIPNHYSLNVRLRITCI